MLPLWLTVLGVCALGVVAAGLAVRSGIQWVWVVMAFGWGELSWWLDEGGGGLGCG